MLQSIARQLSTSEWTRDTAIDQIGASWISDGSHGFGLALLILASLNVLAAFSTIASIFYNAWVTKEWDFYPKTRRCFSFIPTVHPADVFPIIFSTAVIFQGIILIGISAGKSHSNISDECRTIAQVVWPVLWVAPYMSLIFGLETTFRSLQRNKFASQGRWHIMICIGAALMLTLFTWLPSNVSPSRERCLSSLIWWTEGYAKLGVGIALTLVVAYIVCTTVIAIQLMKTDKVDRDQRIQASTVVYYLIVTTIILCLVLPYYIQIIMQGPAIAVSKVAEVALNITGIIPALLRIFLRSGNDWTMIQARNSVRKTKQQLKIGDSDSDIYDQITSPVSLHACDSQTLLRDPEKCPVAPPMRTPVSETPITHTYVANLVPPPATEPEPHTPPYTGQLTQPTTSSRANYSIFPTTGSATIRESVSTVFSQGEEDLEIPRAPFASGHKRDLSEQSSAMVQIGLRLSSLNHSLDPVQGSPISGSPHISSHSPYSSPRFPQKVLQSCPSSPKSPIKDIAVLPIHPTGTQRPSPGQSPMIGVLAPNWLLRKPSNIDLTLPRREKNTMKTLPPTPPGAVALSPSVKKSPQLTRLTSRHDIPNAPSWC